MKQNRSKIDIKIIYNRLNVVSLSLIMFIYCKCHKINPNRGRSYVGSSELIKNKKATISPINKKYKYFQYVLTVALNYKQIGKDPERILKTKPFKNKYTWAKINFLSEKGNWKKFQEDNVAIALNVLCAKKQKIYPANVSKLKP